MEPVTRLVLFHSSHIDSSLRLTAVYCDGVQRIARHSAQYVGIPAQDREDCAGEFLLRLLLLHQRQRQEGEYREFPAAWVRRYATNHAVDFLRRQRRVSRREIEITGEGEEENRYADDAPTPEARVLAQEFLCCIQREVDALTPAQQDLFARLIVNAETAAEVAEDTGHTGQAIRQSQSNLCRQLRALLERRGITESDVREYIRLMEGERGGGKIKSTPRPSMSVRGEGRNRPLKNHP